MTDSVTPGGTTRAGARDLMEEERSRECALLVVLEAGAAWPRWIDRHRTSEEAVVIVRQPDEHPRALLRRIQRAGAELAAAGRCIRTAILALTDGGDDGAMTERALVARALLPHVCRRAGALVIVATALGRNRRHEVLALCGILSEDLAGSGTAVLAELADSVESRDTRTGEWRPARSSGVRIGRWPVAHGARAR